MELIQTIEDSFDFFKKIGMIKIESDNPTTYSYPSLPAKGSATILGGINHYYHLNLNYSLLKELIFHYRMKETYIELGVLEAVRDFRVKEQERLTSPSVGICFMVVRPTGAIGCIYGTRETYCRGNSLILREQFCRKYLFPVVHRVFGSEVDAFSILQLAGNNCLPVWMDLLSALKSCNYAGVAAQWYLDGKVSEVLAALIHAVENLSHSAVPRFDDYERQAVHEIQAILRAQMATPPSIRKLSEQLGLNPNKIQALFKHYTGVTVMEYLRAYRMESALELLLSPASIEEIARQIGYKSASRFSDAFVKSYGILPSKYRKMTT